MNNEKPSYKTSIISIIITIISIMIVLLPVLRYPFKMNSINKDIKLISLPRPVFYTFLSITILIILKLVIIQPVTSYYRIKKNNEIIKELARKMGLKTKLASMQALFMPKKLIAEGMYNNNQLLIRRMHESKDASMSNITGFYLYISIKTNYRIKNNCVMWQDEKLRIGNSFKNFKSHLDYEIIKKKISSLPRLPKTCNFVFAKDGIVIFTKSSNYSEIIPELNIAIQYAERLR